MKEVISSGLLPAILSSLSLAVMAISDRLMVSDFYQGRIRVVWFVSALATLVFGLLACGVLFLITGTEISVAAKFASHGQAVFIAGVLASVTLLLFFKCFDEGGESAVLASWFAASPAYIFVALLLIRAFGFPVAEVKLSIGAGFGVLLASVGLFCIEWFSGEKREARSKYYFYLVAMITINTSYIIIVDQSILRAALQTEIEGEAVTLGLLPWFLLGFVTGVIPIFFKTTRRELILCMPNLQRHWKLIFALEIIGMLVFVFEFQGLSKLDPTFTSIIIGAHLVVVIIFENLLANWGQKKQMQNKASAPLFGIEIQLDSLTLMPTSTYHFVMRTLGVILVMLGMVLFIVS